MAGCIAFRWSASTPPASSRRSISLEAAVSEMMTSTLFVFVGCGTACGHGASDGETRLLVALAFGMCILVLAYMSVHISGGHMNCAVTFTLVLGGRLPWYQGLADFVMQMIGSVLGAALLLALIPSHRDMTGNLASNVISDDFGVGRALLGEALGTFLLCIAVWETAVTSRSKAGPNASLAIGFAVFLAHVLLLPIDGCSINPTRSFGPAIVAEARRGDKGFVDGGLRDLWVMWVGPLLGSAAAAGVKNLFVARHKGGHEEAPASSAV